MRIRRPRAVIAFLRVLMLAVVPHFADGSETAPIALPTCAVLSGGRFRASEPLVIESLEARL
jgi:hypothetical protein